MAKCTDPRTCSRVMQVLADETRLRLVRALLEEAACVGELASQLDLTDARVSHHLGVLRAAGVVEGEREGKSVRYRVSADFRHDDDANALDLGCCLVSFRPLARRACCASRRRKER